MFFEYSDNREKIPDIVSHTKLPDFWNGKRYYSLDAYLKHTYGEKMYKLSLNGGMTCPNRDGTLGKRGCIFCSAGGSGDFAAPASLSISDQIETAKRNISSKVSCNKYIAYFQAFTNTYAPVSYLRKIFMEAITNPDIAILSIATRPDCLDSDVISLLSELNEIKPVWIELGLQTIHPKTSNFIRSGFSLSDFESSVSALHNSGIKVIAHVILGLPNETPDMMLDSVSYLGKLSIFGIKLQLLHILKGTDLCTYYEKHPFPVFTLTEYCDIIAACLELLPPQMVIHRITGDGPKNLLVAPLWSGNKKQVLNQIQKNLKEKNTWQGRLFNN